MKINFLIKIGKIISEEHQRRTHCITPLQIRLVDGTILYKADKGMFKELELAYIEKLAIILEKNQVTIQEGDIFGINMEDENLYEVDESILQGNLRTMYIGNQFQDLIDSAKKVESKIGIPSNPTSGGIISWMSPVYFQENKKFYEKYVDNTWYIGYEGTQVEGVSSLRESAIKECAKLYVLYAEFPGGSYCAE